MKPTIIPVDEMVKLSSSSTAASSSSTSAVTEDTIMQKKYDDDDDDGSGVGMHKKIQNNNIKEKNYENRHKILQHRMQTILRYKLQRKIKTNFVSTNSHYFIGNNKDY